MSVPVRSAQAGAASRRAGFTLVELMVALTVGGLAITSIYAIGAASTKQFFQQHQLASAQTSLRMAINQLKRDFSRAGFLSTPRVDLPGESCTPVGSPLNEPAGSGRLAAFSNFQNDVVISASPTTGNPYGNLAIDPTGTNRANGFRADDIVLFGNYETASEYPGVNVALADPSLLHISNTWYGFQRDFSNWHAGGAVAPTIQQAALDRVFPRDRLVRIRMPTGAKHYGIVNRVSAGSMVAGSAKDTEIRLMASVPAACASQVVNAWIAPVNAMRYYARTAPAAEGELLADTTGPVGQLIREEVMPGDKRTPLLINNVSNTRVVLDYLVAFHLSFVDDRQLADGQPDAYTPGEAIPELTDLNPAPLVAQLNANPENIRSVYIDLAVRTPEQDPTFPFVNCGDMRCFQVFPATGSQGRPGAARVRRMRAEVFVPNVAYEGF